MGSIRKKYPCGYEVEAKDWNYGVKTLEKYFAPEQCPLHGKKCNKKLTKVLKQNH